MSQSGDNNIEQILLQLNFFLAVILRLSDFWSVASLQAKESTDTKSKVKPDDTLAIETEESQNIIKKPVSATIFKKAFFNDSTTFHHACLYALNNYLKQHECGNINQHSVYKGFTGLYLACKMGNLGTVKILLEKKANINLSNQYEAQSPLKLVLEQDNCEVLHLLLNINKKKATKEFLDQFHVNCIGAGEIR